MGRKADDEGDRDIFRRRNLWGDEGGGGRMDERGREKKLEVGLLCWFFREDRPRRKAVATLSLSLCVFRNLKWGGQGGTATARFRKKGGGGGMGMAAASEGRRPKGIVKGMGG